MNIEGAALKLLLTVENRDEALDAFSELSPEYFSKGSKTLYDSIVSYYSRYGIVPTTAQLLVFQHRNTAMKNSIMSVDNIDVESLELDMVVDELKNQYAHIEALNLISKFVHNSITMGREELVESLAEIPLEVEAKMQETFKVGTAANTNFFKSKEEHSVNQILSGISDSWDYEAGGYFIEDLVLIGGRRGGGKSLVCANMVCSQHEQGNPSIYFTIEMTKEEVLGRIICMLAGISANRYRKNELTEEEIAKGAKVLASLFVDGDEVYEKYFGAGGTKSPLEFQRELQRTKKEKDEGRIIIIDDPNLSLATIDSKVNTYKRIYGTKLKLVCVDYLNQVKTGNTNDVDMYDWKAQIFISKSLKALGRKYKLCMVSPYQIDATGEARMSKGILDAADIAQIIHKSDDIITFENTKARGVKEGSKHKVMLCPVHLRIDPKEVKEQDYEDDDIDGKEPSTWDLV